MSDLSLLRWRIEQQSEMIMKLKANLDESTAKLKVQEKINEDTCNINQVVLNQIRQEDEKFEALEKKMSKVSTDFQELLKVKEKAVTLNLSIQQEISDIESSSRNSIKALVEDKSKKVQEKNKLIASAEILLGKLESQYSQLTISNEADVLLQENELLETVHTRTKSELEKMTLDAEKKLLDIMKRLDFVKNKRANLASEREKEEEKLLAENEEFTKRISELNEQINEQNSLQKDFQKQEETLSKELTAIENKFEKERHLINPKLLIRILKEDLNEIFEANQKAQKEFAAYEKHAENLIQREQQLNKKFQLLTP